MNNLDNNIVLATGAGSAQQLPLVHFGEPGDVSATVVFLASDDARIYVGQTLGPNSGDVML